MVLRSTLGHVDQRLRAWNFHSASGLTDRAAVAEASALASNVICLWKDRVITLRIDNDLYWL
jgi:hypothetical protein